SRFVVPHSNGEVRERTTATRRPTTGRAGVAGVFRDRDPSVKPASAIASERLTQLPSSLTKGDRGGCGPSGLDRENPLQLPLGKGESFVRRSQATRVRTIEVVAASTRRSSSA